MMRQKQQPERNREGGQQQHRTSAASHASRCDVRLNPGTPCQCEKHKQRGECEFNEVTRAEADGIVQRQE